MTSLIIVSFIWALSFGLTKTYISDPQNPLDATGVSAIRMALATLVFLPMLRPKKIKFAPATVLMLIGALQFGILYIFYMEGFLLLHAHEVALFTIFTPIYIALANAVTQRRLHLNIIAAVALSIPGAVIILWNPQETNAGLWTGFILIQLSNICFAVGQFAYKKYRPKITGVKDGELFGWLMLGGMLAAGAHSAFATDWKNFAPMPAQWGILLYLGLFSTGVGCYLWNRGVLQVKVGTFAVFNNLKVPLGVIFSLLFFGEKADPVKLAAGLILLAAAVIIAERAPADPGEIKR